MKRLTSLVIVAASLVLATGTATATGATRPDDRPNHGAGAVGLVISSQAVRPDDRATHGPGASLRPPPSRLSPELEALTRSYQASARPAPAIGPVGAGSTGVDGFDWADAGIGAAGALGLGLLLIGGTALTLRQRRISAYS
jgi:hypothetical protein